MGGYSFLNKKTRGGADVKENSEERSARNMSPATRWVRGNPHSCRDPSDMYKSFWNQHPHLVSVHKPLPQILSNGDCL